MRSTQEATQPETTEADAQERWRQERAELLARLQQLPPLQTQLQKSPRALRIALATADEAPLALRIMQEAFAEYEGVLNPPNGAIRETVEDVVRAMIEGGNVLVWQETTPVGSARFRLLPDHLYIGRVAVLPSHRGKGIASALMGYMETIARAVGLSEIRLRTRAQLERNLSLYRRLGYEVVQITRHPNGPDEIVLFTKKLPP